MEDLEAEHLIALVESQPILWDKSRNDFRERAKMRDAWMVVCAQLRSDFVTLPAPEQKECARMIIKRWRNIRDQWLKWRNKHRNPLKYNPGIRAYRRRYLYHDQLQFLEKGMGDFDQAEMSQEEFFDHLAQNDEMERPELLLRIKSSASTESLCSDLGQDSEEPQIESDFTTGLDYLQDNEGPSAKKRKKSSDCENSNNENDRHMMFFRSVIPYLKSFTERQILDFQMGVLQLVRSSMETDPLQTDPLRTDP